MKASEIANRRSLITQLLYQQQQVKVADLVEAFQVSDETIRKDLAYLETEGILKKQYGGAVLIQQERLAPVLNRAPINKEKKLPIVEKAVQHLPANTTSIGLDQGSTIALLAAKLCSLTEKNIFTGSLAAILELANSHHQLYCFGGHYAFEDMAFRNDTSAELYADIQLDVCFFGSSGVQHRQGFCTSSLMDAELKRKLLKKSTKKIVLLDSNKFQQSSLVQVAPWSAVDLVITNDNLPREYYRMIANDTRLITV